MLTRPSTNGGGFRLASSKIKKKKTKSKRVKTRQKKDPQGLEGGDTLSQGSVVSGGNKTIRKKL